MDVFDQQFAIAIAAVFAFAIAAIWYCFYEAKKIPRDPMEMDEWLK